MFYISLPVMAAIEMKRTLVSAFSIVDSIHFSKQCLIFIRSFIQEVSIAYPLCPELCCAQSLSRIHLFVTPWTVACQATLSLGFSRQKYWSGLPCPFPGDLLNLGIEPRSLELQADSLPSEPPGKPKKEYWEQVAYPFLTQESNRDLLHCAWILHQLSYQESPHSALGTR